MELFGEMVVQWLCNGPRHAGSPRTSCVLKVKYDIDR